MGSGSCHPGLSGYCSSRVGRPCWAACCSSMLQEAPWRRPACPGRAARPPRPCLLPLPPGWAVIAPCLVCLASNRTWVSKMINLVCLPGNNGYSSFSQFDNLSCNISALIFTCRMHQTPKISPNTSYAKAHQTPTDYLNRWGMEPRATGSRAAAALTQSLAKATPKSKHFIEKSISQISPPVRRPAILWHESQDSPQRVQRTRRSGREEPPRRAASSAPESRV